MLVNTELNDTNLIFAININVILVAAYSMNVCKFSTRELNELDQIFDRELRVNARKTCKRREASPKEGRWRKRIKINARCI